MRTTAGVAALLLFVSMDPAVAAPPAVSITIRDHTFVPRIVHVKAGAKIV